MKLKKSNNRTVERQRDVQIQDVKTPKEAVSQQQVNKQNITIKIGADVISKAKRKKKKRKQGPSKKKQVIDQIKLSLERLQALKKDAGERGVKIPAELGKLPQDADAMNTVAELTTLLNTLNERNTQIAQLIEQGGSKAQGNVFDEGVFGSGGTFPQSYRLPSSFQQAAPPIIINPAGMPSAAGKPSAPASSLPTAPVVIGRPVSPSTRTAVPRNISQSDEDKIAREITELKKKITDRLGVQVKAGTITEKEYKEKMAGALKAAEAKSGETLRAIMSPQARIDYIKIRNGVGKFQAKIAEFHGGEISGIELRDIKDYANTTIAQIAEFKRKYPELVAAHPELFEFREQLEYLNADPLMLTAQHQGRPVKETGIQFAEMTELNSALKDINDQTEQLMTDYNVLRGRGTLSPAQITGLQETAGRIEANMNALRAKHQFGRDKVSLAYQSAKNKEDLKHLVRTLNVVMALKMPEVVRQPVDMSVQLPIWRLLAYVGEDRPVGDRYHESTFLADITILGVRGNPASILIDPVLFKKEKPNSPLKREAVRQMVDRYMNSNSESGYNRQYQGKDLSVGRGGDPAAGRGRRGGDGRRMLPPQAVVIPPAPTPTATASIISAGAQLGSELHEIPEMMF